MQSTIKSTLSLLISLARPQGPVLGSKVTRTGRPPLTLKPIFAARDAFSPVSLPSFGDGVNVGKVDEVVWKKDKALDGSLSTLGCGFTALGLSLINHMGGKAEDGGKKRYRCQTCLWTQKHDELHHWATGLHTHQTWRNIKERESERNVNLTINKYFLCVLFHKPSSVHVETHSWHYTHTNRQRLPNLVPSAREQIVLMGLMSRHDVTVN